MIQDATALSKMHLMGYLTKRVISLVFELWRLHSSHCEHGKIILAAWELQHRYQQTCNLHQILLNDDTKKR
jgi:hypothetical protein